MRLTESEYEALLSKCTTIAPVKFKPASIAAPKPTKYGNKKVTVDGIVFDSAKESRRYAALTLMQNAGEITELERQRVFVLAPAVILGGRKKPALRYVADFVYTKDGATVIEDVKSKATAENRAFRIKQHLMKSVFNVDVLLT